MDLPGKAADGARAFSLSCCTQVFSESFALVEEPSAVSTVLLWERRLSGVGARL